MADILCPSCKRNNPDFLDVCQFCQTPLKPESMVHIGENPTKKNTGELETVLPEWLRDVRQQSRDSAAEEAAQAAAEPKIQKNEASDFLAGLASQGGSADDDDVPDWLASLSPAADQKPSAPSSPEPKSDFFAQFNKSESEPASQVSEPAQDDAPSIMGGVTGQSQTPVEKDELSEWFSQASEQPSEPVSLESGTSQDDRGWMDNSGPSPTAEREPAPQKEEEDLSWLHDLETSAKQSGDLPAPKQDMGWAPNFETPSSPSQPSISQEDLGWLNDLGRISEPSQPSSSQSSAPQQDLSWLNNLGGASEPSQPAPSQPSAPQQDLSWLKDLGGISEPSQPVDQRFDELNASPQGESAPSTPSVPQEDLGWLKNLGEASEPSQLFEQPQSQPTSSQPSASQQDLSWLDNLGGESEPLSAPAFAEPASDLGWLDNMEEEQSGALPPSAETLSPRHTAPLSDEAAEAPMPDWLKSATEEPSMPMGAEALDQFREKYRPAATHQPAEQEPLPPAGQPATVDSNLFAPAGDSSSLSSQDVDSLFSVEMPDWLSRPDPSAAEATSQETAAPTIEGADALAPVDLPSWVQAMRPVEAVISETEASVEDQPTETEGPLMGLRGVIPIAPIGSSRRPKAFSLKLQATDEQQASAALLEQILAGETAPRPMVTSSFVMSQHVLRWVLTGLFLIVLGAMIGIRSQAMPVSPALPDEVGAASNAIVNIPENAPVLVVIDYEPSLAGEMEATSGPLLDQMVLLRHPRLSFLSTSPNGFALVERLMTNTKLNRPTPDGLGYKAGEQYFNLGYLAGGPAGVLGFVTKPDKVLPSAGVKSLSEYKAVVVLTDHAESGRIWVEQLENLKRTDPALASQPLLMVSSAQAGPLLQPYVSSRQITGMVSGLSDAVRYEFVNNSRPGIARTYWDAFGVGLLMAMASITIGGLWSLFTGIRARRAGAEKG